MLIYKAVNIINKKVYIGQTNNSLEKRRHNHFKKSLKLNSKFAKALREFGSNNFEWSVIEECKSLEELNKKEKYWIKYYNSFKNGYNSTAGGGPSQQTHNNIIPFKNVLDAFKDMNYTLLISEEEYKGVHLKAKYKCDRGHIQERAIYLTTRRKAKCQQCQLRKKRLKYDDLTNLFKSKDYKLLTTKCELENRERALQIVNVLCPQGHNINISINNFKNNHGCKLCAIEAKKGVSLSLATKKKISVSKKGKLNKAWINIPDNDMQIIIEGHKERLSAYKIAKYKLNNKYSCSLIRLRIKEIKI